MSAYSAIRRTRLTAVMHHASVAERLDPVVEAALDDLTDFVFRYAPQAGEALDEHNSRAGAVHLFQHLKYHGHRLDPDSVELWALEHNWPESDAHALADYACRVQEGVRYHTTPDPFGRHAYLQWRERSLDRLSQQPTGAPESRYWFWSYPCEDYDYLYDAGWTTFPGRMAAYCPHRFVAYRQSRYELPPDLPERTSAWVAGYLAGSLPRPPEIAWNDEGDEQPEVMRRWEAAAEQFRTTGWWPHPEDLEQYYDGRAELPLAPRQFDPDVLWPEARLGSRERPPPPDS